MMISYLKAEIIANFSYNDELQGDNETCQCLQETIHLVVVTL